MSHKKPVGIRRIFRKHILEGEVQEATEEVKALAGNVRKIASDPLGAMAPGLLGTVAGAVVSCAVAAGLLIQQRNFQVSNNEVEYWSQKQTCCFKRYFQFKIFSR